MEHLFCTKCGGRLVEHANFCVKCGAPVVRFQPEQEQAAADVLTDEVTAADQPEVCEAAEEQEMLPVAPVAVEEPPAEPQNDCVELFEPIEEQDECAESVESVEMQSECVEPCEPVEPFEPVEQQTESAAPCEEVKSQSECVAPCVDTEVQSEWVEPYMPAAPQIAPHVVPQAEVQPAPQSAPQKPARQRVRRGVLRTLLAILLCISMFTVTCVTVVVFGLQYSTSERNLEVFASEVTGELYTLLDTLPAAVIIPEITDNTSLVDYVIELALENGLRLDRRGVGEILASSEIVDNISGRMIAYLTDIRRGTNKAAMDERDLLDFLEDGRDVVEDVLNIRISDSDLEETAELVADTGVLELTNAKLLEKHVPVVYYSIQYTLSVWLLCVLAAIVLLHIALLNAANRWSFSRTTSDTGITFMVAGFLTALPAALLPILAEGLIATVPVFGNMLDIVITYLSESFMVGGLITMCLGVLLIIMSVVARTIAAKRMA